MLFTRLRFLICFTIYHHGLCQTELWLTERDEISLIWVWSWLKKKEVRSVPPFFPFHSFLLLLRSVALVVALTWANALKISSFIYLQFISDIWFFFRVSGTGRCWLSCLLLVFRGVRERIVRVEEKEILFRKNISHIPRMHTCWLIRADGNTSRFWIWRKYWGGSFIRQFVHILPLLCLVLFITQANTSFFVSGVFSCGSGVNCARPFHVIKG